MKQRKSRKVIWARAAWMVLVCLWGTASSYAQGIQLQEVRLSLRGAGSIYQMRWGNTADSSDLIPLPPRWWRDGSGNPHVNPGCLRKSSEVRMSYTIQNNTGMPLGCTIFVILSEQGPGGSETVWSQNYGTAANPLPYPQTSSVNLPTWPGYIAPLNLHVEFDYYVYKSSWMPVPPSPNEMVGIGNYSILGSPASPMSPPWAKILAISCRWMRRTSSEASAQSLLTKRMFGVKYDASSPPKAYVDDGYAVWLYNPSTAYYSPHWYPSEYDIQEDQFWLQDWYMDSGGGSTRRTGQCTEVSDLWGTMATSVGCARNIQLVNRPLAGEWFSYNPSYRSGNTTAGTYSGSFNYHQLAWADVYDAAIAFPDSQLHIRWSDANGNGIIDPGESMDTAELATGTGWDSYVSMLWAGGGTRPYRYRNPTLTVSFVQHP